MILPDVNVLVYAFHRDTSEHQPFADWLDSVIADAEPLLLPDVVLTGFLRVTTHRRIFSDPAPMPAALAFAETLRTSPANSSLNGTDATWRQLAQFAKNDSHIAGNLVPDAWIASLALTYGARVATADAGFARFDNLIWFNPARGR